MDDQTPNRKDHTITNIIYLPTHWECTCGASGTNGSAGYEAHRRNLESQEHANTCRWSHQYHRPAAPTMRAAQPYPGRVMNRRTKKEVLAAWRQVLTADLSDEVTAAKVAEVVGIAPVTARQWLNTNVGPGTAEPSETGWMAKRWPTAAVRAAVERMQGPGNRSGNRGRGRTPKAHSDQTSQEGNPQ